MTDDAPPLATAISPGTKPWSYEIAQGRPPIPGELEALSRRYGNAPILILPLSCGRFAIFGVDRQLRYLCDEAPTSAQLRDWSAEAEALARHRVLRVESTFYGEPADGELARDLKRTRAREDAPPRERVPSGPPVPAEW